MTDTPKRHRARRTPPRKPRTTDANPGDDTPRLHDIYLQAHPDTPEEPNSDTAPERPAATSPDKTTPAGAYEPPDDPATSEAVTVISPQRQAHELFSPDTPDIDVDAACALAMGIPARVIQRRLDIDNHALGRIAREHALAIHKASSRRAQIVRDTLQAGIYGLLGICNDALGHFTRLDTAKMTTRDVMQLMSAAERMQRLYGEWDRAAREEIKRGMPAILPTTQADAMRALVKDLGTGSK